MRESKSELLPEGYYFADRELIKGEEVIELRSSSGWGTETRASVWDMCLRHSLVVVGVRNQDTSLVGIGFIAGNVRHAVMCDFTVHIEHRSKGIGNAIIEKRLEIADELGVRYMYTELAPTNTLASRYVELGFRPAENILERGTEA